MIYVPFLTPSRHPYLQMAFYDYQLFGAESIEKMTAIVYDDVRKFCQNKGLQLHMTTLTTNALGLSRSTDYPTGLLGLSTFKNT